MKNFTTYFHSLKGRLRIKIAPIKDSVTKAHGLENRLKEIAGIEYIKANPVTGNVLILYDHGTVRQNEIIQALSAFGYLEPQNTSPKVLKQVCRNEAISRKFTKLFANITCIMVEVALQNLITSLI